MAFALPGGGPFATICPHIALALALVVPTVADHVALIVEGSIAGLKLKEPSVT